MNTIKPVPSLSQNFDLLRAICAPSGIPASSDRAMDIRPIWMETGALDKMTLPIGTPTA